jgi:hypothetical protein
VNGAKIEPGKAVSSGNSTDVDGALRLNGKDQFVELPVDVADMGDCTYTAEVMWNGVGDGARIFEFTNSNGDGVALSPSVNGQLTFAMRKGEMVEGLTAPAIKKAVWTTIQVILNGNRAVLLVNGIKVAEKRNLTLAPESVRATQCYLGRGLRGDHFGGLIGRFTVHSIALVDSEPPSPNPPTFAMTPTLIAPTSIMMTATPGKDPLGVVEYYFEAEGAKWTSGWVADPAARVDFKKGLNPGRFRVKMRDKSGNETAFSEVIKAEGLGKFERIHEVKATAPTVVEAEQCVAAVPSLDGVNQWEKQTNPPGFVGEGFMAVPDRGVVNEPFSATAAHLDYALHFTKPGRYFLWVRANGNNDGGASIHAGFGLKAEPWGINLRTGNGRYAWTRSPAFQIDAPGGYLFSLWMREDGAMLDRFLITADESYEPSPAERAPDRVMIGEGPAESPFLRSQSRLPGK